MNELSIPAFLHTCSKGPFLAVDWQLIQGPLFKISGQCLNPRHHYFHQSEFSILFAISLFKSLSQPNTLRESLSDPEESESPIYQSMAAVTADNPPEIPPESSGAKADGVKPKKAAAPRKRSPSTRPPFLEVQCIMLSSDPTFISNFPFLQSIRCSGLHSCVS